MTAKIILHLPVWWWKKCSWWWLLKCNRRPCEEGAVDETNPTSCEQFWQWEHMACCLMVWWAVSHGGTANVWWPSMRFNNKLLALIRPSRESAGGRWSKSIIMRTVLTLGMCYKSWLFDGQSVMVVWAMSYYHQWVGLIRPRCWKWLPYDTMVTAYLVVLRDDTEWWWEWCVQWRRRISVLSWIPSTVSHQIQLGKIW